MNFKKLNIYKIVSYHFYDGGFWFRIFDFGICISNKIKNPPLFSERYGFFKVIRVGRYGFAFLKRKEF